MQVILKERIPGKGKIGQLIQVKRGYARNYLFPRGLALPVTQETLVWLESQASHLAALEQEALEQAQALAAKFSDVLLTFHRVLKDDDALFGSIGVSEILHALKSDHGIGLDRSMVVLKEGNIRALGDYTARIHLHEHVVVDCPIQVLQSDNEK